jgi:hypothetical protein
MFVYLSIIHQYNTQVCILPLEKARQTSHTAHSCSALFLQTNDGKYFASGPPAHHPLLNHKCTTLSALVPPAASYSYVAVS